MKSFQATCELGMCAVAAAHLAASGAYGQQDYPNKLIRIVTSSVGSGSDFISRLIGNGISGPLGQQVIVVNFPSGNASGVAAAKSPPDGHTMLVAAGSHWIGPLLREAAYDPVRDFAPIILLSSEPQQLVVHPSLPIKSVKELIALAKARPGQLNASSSSVGGGAHLAVELFKSMAGVDIVNIPYKSVSQGITDLIGGHVELRFGGAAAVAPHVKSGKLRALAVTSAEPSALFPGIPTIAASVPGYEATSLTATFAPAKTPDAAISRLNQEIGRVLNLADVKEKLSNAGQEIVSGSPERLATALKADLARWSKVIKDAGIRAD